MERPPITVHEFGNRHAPDLVLLHGLTEAGTAWPDAVSRWGESWRLWALDQRGHGHSPRFDAPGREVLMDVWVADLLGFLSSLGHPAIVAGHSLSGRVASVAAIERPDLFAGLLLEDPALTDGTIASPEFAEQNFAFLATFDNGGLEAEKQRMRRDSSWTAAEIDAWADCKPLVDRRLFANLDLGHYRASNVLNELRVPTLIIWDADGPSRPTPPTSLIRWSDVSTSPMSGTASAAMTRRRSTPSLTHGCPACAERQWAGPR